MNAAFSEEKAAFSFLCNQHYSQFRSKWDILNQRAYAR
jgi:hypothetical protein